MGKPMKHNEEIILLSKWPGIKAIHIKSTWVVVFLNKRIRYDKKKPVDNKGK